MARIDVCRVAALTLLTSSVVVAPAAIHADDDATSIGEPAQIVRGGKLYDKWWAEAGLEKPAVAHPAYPSDAKYAGSSSDWRCKECHGWDYLGADGAYSEGSHFTGIPGILSSIGSAVDDVIATLKNDTHAYGDAMSDQDYTDLALFVSKGMIDMDQYIDRETKAVIGADPAKGKPLFQTVCANCHGLNGALDEDGEPISGDAEPLGPVARGNPWETLHKIRNGQPDENMPALATLDLQVALDMLAYLQTLPEE